MKSLTIRLAGFFVSFLTMLPRLVFAQGKVDVGANLDDIASKGGFGAGVGASAPEVVIGNLIQGVLAFLGVAALVIVVYAGVLWLTSGGVPDKVDKAKKVLAAAIIGLIIIFSSYAITGFVVNLIVNAVK